MYAQDTPPSLPPPMSTDRVEWLKELITNNDLHKFYGSSEWQALAAQARDMQHNECQRCKAKGYYSPCEIVHHIRYVKKFPELALSLENLECLCKNCHEEEHKIKNKFVNDERW